MNTFQLKCFLTVTETLNFARAAQLLNITQPAVTHQIRSLENELNVRLFKRTTRNVELTHEGQLFINGCLHREYSAYQEELYSVSTARHPKAYRASP